MSHSNPAVLVTLISAVHNVGPFVLPFLRSIDEQAGPAPALEVVLVDDGSTDDSVEKIEQWLRVTTVPARLIRKDNGGVASARNLGLDHATGRWVTFPDPDDVLSPGYFALMADALSAADGNDEPSIVAARVLEFSADPGSASDSHPLDYRYRGGRRMVRLDDDGRWFHAHVASGLYRRSVIEETGLRFDSRLNVGFEDAKFAGQYLLSIPDPTVLVVPEAEYRYRRRADGTSLVGSMWSKPEKYLNVPRYGYLELLHARAVPPLWLQFMIAYDLQWYFWEYLRPDSLTRAIDEGVRSEFLRLLDDVLARLDDGVIATFPLHSIEPEIPIALATRKTGRVPLDLGLVRLPRGGTGATIAVLSAAPDEPLEVEWNGQSIAPDVRAEPVEFFGEPFAYRIVFDVCRDGTTSVWRDSRLIPLANAETGGYLGPALTPWGIERSAGEASCTRLQLLRAALPDGALGVARRLVRAARVLRNAGRRLTRRGRGA